MKYSAPERAFEEKEVGQARGGGGGALDLAVVRYVPKDVR